MFLDAGGELGKRLPAICGRYTGRRTHLRAQGILERQWTFFAHIRLRNFYL